MNEQFSVGFQKTAFPKWLDKWLAGRTKVVMDGAKGGADDILNSMKGGADDIFASMKNNFKKTVKPHHLILAPILLGMGIGVGQQIGQSTTEAVGTGVKNVFTSKENPPG